jgi:uncharacterized ferredoxin-like protein
MAVELITRDDLEEIKQFMERLANRIEQQHQELLKLRDNRLMSVEDVIAYTGFKNSWVLQHKEEIGYCATGKDIKFYKDDIDQYFKAKKIQFKK